MPYTKTTWVSTVTAIDAAPLNNLESQITEVKKKLIPPTVRWTTPGWSWGGRINTVVAANRIYYMPIYVAEVTTYIRIGIEVQAGDGAGGLADLRIFDFGAGIPTDLVLSAGTVNTNGAGLQEIVIAQALGIGYYFLAFRCDQAPTCWAPPATHTFTLPVSGLSLTGNMTNDLVVLYDDAAYADPAGAVDGALNCQYGFVTLREN